MSNGNGLAFIAMVSLLAGLIFFESALNNLSIADYTKGVLKIKG